MEKPIIATTLSGLFLSQKPWKNAHVLWYENASIKLNDDSVKQWAFREDYFKGVDEVMKRLYPRLSDEQRTKKARELFFNSVCQYIKKHSEVRNDSVVKYFESLKSKYRIALITTNTQSALKKILPILDLNNLFDITETSLPKEKDDKRKVFDRFIEKHGKPLIYIGGSRKDSFDYCKEYGIPCIYANLEKEEEIHEVTSVHNLAGLKKELRKLI